MKKLLGMILVIALLAGAAFAQMEEKAAPGNRLGWILLDKLYAEGENAVISPYSMALALGMAAEGAEGETLAQLLEALGAEDVREMTEVVPEGIKSANSAFVNPAVELKEEYIAKLKEYYGAEQFEIDGEVVEKVNAWVKEKTDGLIESMLNEAPDLDTGMLLLNAIAMEADWAKPFYESGTAEEIFHAADGDIMVQMMRQTDRFRYAEKDGVQIICLPYANSDLEMWIALPAADESGLKLPELLGVLAAEGSFYLESDAEMKKVNLSLPKFDAADENSLAKLMQELGINLPFDTDEAQFGGISEVPMYIGEIVQKARVQVDEAGTKAAASTMVVMPMMAAAPGMEEKPVEMKVDRPFAFVISDSASGSVCFAGAVEIPEV